MKKIRLVVIILAIFCLSGCGLIEELVTVMNEAATFMEDFCCELAEDDLEEAKGYLHPDSKPTQEDLSSFIATLEQANDIDFSDGIAFKSRTDFSSTYYDSKYGGSVYELTYQIVVGSETVYFFAVVVSNDNGYGIYSFGIEN